MKSKKLKRAKKPTKKLKRTNAPKRTHTKRASGLPGYVETRGRKPITDGSVVRFTTLRYADLLALRAKARARGVPVADLIAEVVARLSQRDCPADLLCEALAVGTVPDPIRAAIRMWRESAHDLAVHGMRIRTWPAAMLRAVVVLAVR